MEGFVVSINFKSINFERLLFGVYLCFDDILFRNIRTLTGRFHTHLIYMLCYPPVD